MAEFRMIVSLPRYRSLSSDQAEPSGSTASGMTSTDYASKNIFTGGPRVPETSLACITRPTRLHHASGPCR
jgi:hypothetical protein